MAKAPRNGESRTALAEEARPIPRNMLPFKVLQGPMMCVEYEGEIRIADRTIRQPYRMQNGPLLDAVLRTLEMYRELERERDLAVSERDQAMARAINAEAELAKTEGWTKPRG